MIGAVLGSYRVVSEVGAGGMGTVYLGEHTTLGSSAAIKVLRPELSENTGIVQRFFDEARAATRVNHPAIVTVLDFGWQDRHAYLVMEYLRGHTLTQVIYRDGRDGRDARVPPVRALELVRQCAVAMAAAHAAGIVHRDLKPDNIFVVADASGGELVKVLDFGIAKLLGEDGEAQGLTRTGTIMGTPAYMSPEQCRGAGRVDHRTDVYALGCVLYHVLTGRPPFLASTPGDLIAAHLTSPPRAPSTYASSITRSLDRLVLHCLEKDADQRMPTMTALVAAIDSIDLTETIPPVQVASATPASLVPATATTMGSSMGEVDHAPRRWRGGVIALAVAVLAGGAIAALTMTSRSRATTPRDAAMVTTSAAAPPDGALVGDAAILAGVVDAAAHVDAARAGAGRHDAPRSIPPRDAGVVHALTPRDAAARPSPQPDGAYDPMNDR